MNNFDLKYFKALAILEGLSLLCLFFIAMPMKRIFGEPQYVSMIGSIHGVLFLMYFYTLISIKRNHSWEFKKFALAFIMASVPFGTFWFERKFLKNL